MKHKFKTGQMLNFSTNTIFGLLIKFHNKLKFRGKDLAFNPTHIGIISNVTKDTVEVFEALNSGTTFTIYPKDKLNRLLDNNKLKIIESKKQLKNVKKVCSKYNNIRYGKLKTFIAITLNLFSKRLATKIPDTTSDLICSEVVARVCYDCSDKKVNFEKEYNITYHLVTPAHIHFSNQVKVLK